MGEKRYGIQLQPHRTDQLTNLRLADDILIVSTSLKSLTQMIADLSNEASKIGLKLHADKTKILHNRHTTTPRRTPEYVTANNLRIEVLPTASDTKYLGRKLCFGDYHRTEVENRISQACKRFHSLKAELTGRRYSLNDRLHLFHGTITPTVLYASEC